MKYERGTIYDYLGDFIVYRNLKPADPRLRPLSAIAGELGVPAGRIPRKAEPDYARVILHFLHQTQALRQASVSLAGLIYLGDNHLLDGAAFRNLRDVSGWPAEACIITARPEQPPNLSPQSDLWLGNRWSMLADFLRVLQERGFPLDARTAVVVDLDKTAIGARGRNDKVIDAARVAAVEETVAKSLGPAFDLGAFRRVYDELSQPRYHPFTADNQDYLVYICLMIMGGVYEYQTLLDDLSAGRLTAFLEFLEICDRRLAGGGFPLLEPFHAEVAANVRRGDPTPFKSFRRCEFVQTVARMDVLPDDTPLEQLLVREITLTAEVAAAVRSLQERGVLAFGLSDKPDEASVPTPELAAQGYQPLHRTVMKVIGEH